LFFEKLKLIAQHENQKKLDYFFREKDNESVAGIIHYEFNDSITFFPQTVP